MGVVWGIYTVRCHYTCHVQFSQTFSQKTPHSSPVSVRYGVSFVSSKSDLYSIAVIAILCAISGPTVLRYNGIWLYLVKMVSKHPESTVVMLQRLLKNKCAFLKVHLTWIFYVIVTFCSAGVELSFPFFDGQFIINCHFSTGIAIVEIRQSWLFAAGEIPGLKKMFISNGSIDIF